MSPLLSPCLIAYFVLGQESTSGGMRGEKRSLYFRPNIHFHAPGLLFFFIEKCYREHVSSASCLTARIVFAQFWLNRPCRRSRLSWGWRNQHSKRCSRRGRWLLGERRLPNSLAWTTLTSPVTPSSSLSTRYKCHYCVGWKFTRQEKERQETRRERSVLHHTYFIDLCARMGSSLAAALFYCP